MVTAKVKTQVTMVTTMVRIEAVLAVMVMCLASTLSFNLNTELARVLTGVKGTYYGYSVALWADKENEKWLVVGAPRGRNSSAAKNTYPLGDIYICNAFGGQCSSDTRVPFLSPEDTSEAALSWGSSIRNQGIGFGETIFTRNKPNSKLLVCAPRYPRKFILQNYIFLQPKGACYILSSSRERYLKIVPFDGTFHKRNGKSLVNTYTFTADALAGMSGVMSQDERDVYMGGPNAFYGQGVLVRTRAQAQSAVRANKDNFGNDTLDHSWEGWSMVAAKFDGKTELLAASRPCINNGLGSVTFQRPSLRRQERCTLQGQDVGAMFGYSLGAGDLDGDGAADLLIGAPYSSGADGLLPDAGKVYVHYAPCGLDMVSGRVVLEGEEAWGLFGKAVTSPGDLNQDGFDDVVVGAPGNDGRIYVYNGQQNEISDKPTQIIRASQFSAGLRGFGFSLDGGIDIDNNGYPDLLIGAAESDTAVLLRSAPVAKLSVDFRFEPETINLNDRSCMYERVNPEDWDACFDLVIGFEEINRTTNAPIELELEIELDRVELRLAFLENGSYKYKLKINHTITGDDSTRLFRETIFMKRIRQLSQAPGTAHMNITLKPQTPTQEGKTILDVPKVLDALSPTSYKASLKFRCDDENTCSSSPDLVLHAHAPEQLVVGEEQLAVNTTLGVKNDTAYDIKLYIHFPSELHYIQTVLSRFKQVPNCKTGNTGREAVHNVLTCSFFSNLLEGDEIPLTFLFGHIPMESLTNNNSDLTFHLNVTSDSKDLNEADNTLSFTIKKATKVNLLIEGMSEPEVVKGRANESLTLEKILNQGVRNASSADELGPRIMHQFSITNRGPTPLLDGQIQLQLPSSPKTGMPFYMVETPITSGPIECSPPVLNPLKFIDPNVRDRGSREKTQDAGLPEEDVKRSKRWAEGPSAYPPSAAEDPASAPSFLFSSSSSSSPGSLSTSSPSSLSAPKTLATLQPLNESTTLNEDDNEVENANEAMIYNCSRTKCQIITCNVFNLMADESVTLDIVGYVSVGMFKRLKQMTVLLSTTMTLHTNQSCVSANEGDTEACDLEGEEEGDDDQAPRNDLVEGEGDDQVVPQLQENFFTITADTVVTIIKRTEVPRSLSLVPPWKLFIAVLVALLIIVIIFVILYKVGFFKRKHRLTTEQREMLRASQKRRTRVQDTTNS